MREHNEDSHCFDADKGIFIVCDGMGGHAAGEVASEMAILTIRAAWASQETQQLVDMWTERGSPEARQELLARVRAGAAKAHEAIVAAGTADQAKSGMGTTLVGALVVGSELIFAQAGDSRAYLVRDGIAMQLTEDHTLLARLLAAGIEVDVTGEGARFRSMLTNALGIGQESKITTFAVPLADGDRFLLCSDGISEYVPESEVGTVLTTQASPARAAQKLVELALARGGADNATAVVVRVLEAGEQPQPAAQLKRESEVIASSPLWGRRMSPQGRLRALRIAMPRELAVGERVPPHSMGDRVAWILLEGELELDHAPVRPGACLYPESLAGIGAVPDRDGQATVVKAARVLGFRADDWRELCADDTELGEVLQEALAQLLESRGVIVAQAPSREERPHTSSEVAEPPPPVAAVGPPGPPPPRFIDAPTVSERRPRTDSGQLDAEVAGSAATPSSGVPVTAEDRELTPSTGIPIAAPEPRRTPTSPPPLPRRAQTEPGVAARARPPSRPPPGMEGTEPAPPTRPSAPAFAPSRPGANVVPRRATPMSGLSTVSARSGPGPNLPPAPTHDAPTVPRASSPPFANTTTSNAPPASAPLPGAPMVDAPTVTRTMPIPSAAFRPARAAPPPVGVPIAPTGPGGTIRSMPAMPRLPASLPHLSRPPAIPSVVRPPPTPPHRVTAPLPAVPASAPDAVAVPPRAELDPTDPDSDSTPSGARAKRASDGWDD